MEKLIVKIERKFTTESTGSVRVFLKPYFKITDLGFEPIKKREEEFPNNGLIFVTALADDLERGIFYIVDLIVSDNWDETLAKPSDSKYITRGGSYATQIGYLDRIAQLVEGHYPNPSTGDGMTYSSENEPEDGCFILCQNPEGNSVVLGPFDLVPSSKEQDGGVGRWSFEVQPLNRPTKGRFSDLMKTPNCVHEYREDEIADNSICDTEYGKYLVNFENQLPSTPKVIDLASPDSLINWLKKSVRKSPEKIDDNFYTSLNKVKKVLEEVNLGENLGYTTDLIEQRKEKLRNILDSRAKEGEEQGVEDLIGDLVDKPAGQEILKKYIEQNFQAILGEYKEKELKNITTEIQTEKREAKKENETFKQALDAEIEILKEQKTQENISLDPEKSQHLEEKLEKYKDFENLEQKKEQIEAEINTLQEKKFQGDEILAEIKSDIQKSSTEQRKSLLKLKQELDVLSWGGEDPEDFEVNKIVQQKGTDDEKFNDNATEQITIVNKVENYLEAKGRRTDFRETLVLITALMQNLVVTLSGKPGSGKSSMVGLISESLGLKESNKFVQIQTQRGWTSDRDILGFENKITNKYEVDRYGFYKLLSSMQDERSLNNELAITMLDEANLSPIEHYWSAFMDAFDHPESFKTQGKESIKLPKGLRFLATINNDQTTETFSARFLDRSPVITMFNKNVTIQSISSEDSDEDLKPLDYSYEFLENCFKGHNDLDSDITAVLNGLKDYECLEIEHRKMQAFQKLTSSLFYPLRLMDNGSSVAYDYGILLHLLPKINGQGQKYRENLEKLQGYLEKNNYEMSEKKVSQIIEDGSQSFESYSYFSS